MTEDALRDKAGVDTPSVRGSKLLLLVVFVDRSDEEQEIIHIISARKAEEYEQRTYASQF